MAHKAFIGESHQFIGKESPIPRKIRIKPETGYNLQLNLLILIFTRKFSNNEMNKNG